MTEQTNADLIAEARDIWEADDLYPDQMIPRLVKALEASDQERGQYAAVVEAIQSWFNEYNGEDPGVGGWYALEVNLEATAPYRTREEQDL